MTISVSLEACFKNGAEQAGVSCIVVRVSCWNRREISVLYLDIGVSLTTKKTLYVGHWGGPLKPEAISTIDPAISSCGNETVVDLCVR